jgi:hypothetical protein
MNVAAGQMARPCDRRQYHDGSARKSTRSRHAPELERRGSKRLAVNFLNA